MDRTLAEFIRALRSADVRVSVAETLDSLRTAELIGYEDRTTLRDAFSLILAKTPEDKERFFEVFDRFFAFSPFSDTPPGGEDGAEGAPPPPGEAGTASETSNGEGSLAEMLLNEDRAGLAMAIQQAAQQVGLSQIHFFTQRGLYTRRMLEALGLLDLNAEIGRLREEPGEAARQRADALRAARERLQEEVQDFVEKHLSLYGGATIRRLREETLKRIKLSNADQQDFQHMRLLVQRMAKRLAAIHSKRRRVHDRGHLDVRKTLRRNMGNDGVLMVPHWKSRRIERPRVFAICDVSKSVSAYARFLLLFLYSLNDVLPRVRSFAFSAELEEVTAVFKANPPEDAMNHILDRIGFGSTDYGLALTTFRDFCYAELNSRSTVIMLGDGRSNYGEIRLDLLKEVYKKSGRVLWLNPEPRSLWDTGDSEMRRFSANCHQVEVCNTLVHIERVMDNLLRGAK